MTNVIYMFRRLLAARISMLVYHNIVDTKILDRPGKPITHLWDLSTTEAFGIPTDRTHVLRMTYTVWKHLNLKSRPKEIEERLFPAAITFARVHLRFLDENSRHCQNLLERLA